MKQQARRAWTSLNALLLCSLSACSKPVDLASRGMVKIPAGIFLMGSPASELDRSDNEIQHRVTISFFALSKKEVSQDEWVAVMGFNPSYFKGSTLPVEQVSWRDALVYCNKRSLKEGLSPSYSLDGAADPDEWDSDFDTADLVCDWKAGGYRLPTEAEWEYACRAGTQTPFSTGANITTAQANYDGNYPYNGAAKGECREKSMPVGSFAPNPWGLYDMHGNVWEWCWDWYGDYGTEAQSNPRGAAGGVLRVFRGGGWGISGEGLRSACRILYDPDRRGIDLGFRMALSL